jgi:Glycosyltransferase family 28 C-terminal domain
MAGRVVSFAWNNKGMGHASRLVAVHSVMRGRGHESLFLVEHEHRLISDYGFLQVVIPPHPKSLIGDEWWGSGDKFSARVAEKIIRAVVCERDVILHDVVVHRLLYERASKLGCRQFLIHRARRGRPDLADWVASSAPEIQTVFVLGHSGESVGQSNIRLKGVSDVVRDPVDNRSIWRDGDAELRIAVSAAGGGNSDAESFLNAALMGIKEFSEEARTAASVVLTTGPYFRGMVEIPAGMCGSVRVTSYIDALHSLYRGTSAMVVHGGYNTVQELRRCGIPAVGVVGRRPLDDQAARLTELAVDGNVVVVEATAEAITTGLQRVLIRTHDQVGAARVAQHGAMEIAESIISQ